jgi:hypothetical protein
MDLSRLDTLRAQCAALRERALVECRTAAFSHLDRAMVRLDAALFETRRGRHESARAFVWSARDLISSVRF